jgi:hypothetical protein
MDRPSWWDRAEQLARLAAAVAQAAYALSQLLHWLGTTIPS